MSSMTLALLIFGSCYLVIMTERIHKTIVALSGAALMIAFGVVSQDEAFTPTNSAWITAWCFC
jgi:Na+/H+ antiporter NhaD/arsenite permease-like protein